MLNSKSGQIAIFVLMISIIFYGFVLSPYMRTKEKVATDDLSKGAQSIKSMLSFRDKLIILGVVILFIVFGFIFMRNDSQNFQAEAKKPEKYFKPVVSNICLEEYERQTKLTTERELEKLRKNPKFQQMLREKGTDRKKWVWQTREKEEKQVFREGNDTSDEDEDLSYI